MWTVAELNEEYIERMEEVLAVYEKPCSAEEPVVCVDEKPVVLHQEVRPVVAMKPGQVARRDSEYKTAWNGQRVLRSRAEGGAVLSQGNAQSFLLAVCRLSTKYRSALRHRPDNPSGDGQSELPHAQSGSGAFWRKRRWLAMEPLHRPLHAQARQLAEPGRDCHQSVFPAMPESSPHRRSTDSAAGNTRLEKPHQPRPSPHPVEFHS